MTETLNITEKRVEVFDDPIARTTSIGIGYLVSPITDQMGECVVIDRKEFTLHLWRVCMVEPNEMLENYVAERMGIPVEVCNIPVKITVGRTMKMWVNDIDMPDEFKHVKVQTDAFGD